MSHANPQVCLVVIGNEILSGRTVDKNINYVAKGCAERGLSLQEVRIIPDKPEVIVATINQVRATYDHVFTTGGIGPTHDDITSECVAQAFGVPWEPHPEAWARMERSYPPGQFNAARQRMATMPRGATLIDNPISTAPGFSIGNVHVMAGVPRIMQAMFDNIAHRLAAGPPIKMQAVHVVRLGEGVLATGLAAIQHDFPDVDLGSYPFYRPSANGVAVVAKGTDEARLKSAIAAVTDLITTLGGTPVQGEPPEQDA